MVAASESAGCTIRRCRDDSGAVLVVRRMDGAGRLTIPGMGVLTMHDGHRICGTSVRLGGVEHLGMDGGYTRRCGAHRDGTDHMGADRMHRNLLRAYDDTVTNGDGRPMRMPVRERLTQWFEHTLEMMGWLTWRR